MIILFDAMTMMMMICNSNIKQSEQQLLLTNKYAKINRNFSNIIIIINTWFIHSYLCVVTIKKKKINFFHFTFFFIILNNYYNYSPLLKAIYILLIFLLLMMSEVISSFFFFNFLTKINIMCIVIINRYLFT